MLHESYIGNSLFSSRIFTQSDVFHDVSHFSRDIQGPGVIQRICFYITKEQIPHRHFPLLLNNLQMMNTVPKGGAVCKYGPQCVANIYFLV